MLVQWSSDYSRSGGESEQFRQLKLRQEFAIAVPPPFSLFDLNRPRQVEEGESFRQELDHVQLSELGGLKPERKP
mgnify:CR=1 FL=1